MRLPFPHRWAFLALFSCVSLWTAADAAVVYLKDGSQLKGTIVAATAQDITLFSNGSTQRLTTDRIARIDYDESGAPPVQAESPVPSNVTHFDPVARYNYIDDGHQLFSFNFGLATPLSRISLSQAGGGSGDNGNTGILLGGQYLVLATPRFGAGFDFEYANRGASSSLGLLPNADTNVSGDSLMMLAMFRYSILTRGWARPYFSAGIGANRTATQIDSTPLLGFSWSDTNTDETRRLVDNSNWGLATTARFGIDFNAPAPAFFSLELGWIGITNGRIASTPSGQDLGLSSVRNSLDMLVFSGRWSWRF